MSARIVVDDRDSGFVPTGCHEVPLIHGREQGRRVGKEPPPKLARKHRGGAADRHDQVRLGTIDEAGSDVGDHRWFRRADKPCRTHHDLDDGNWSPRARLEIDAKVGGEGIKRKIAAGERLQHEDVRWRRLGFGWGRTEQQPGCHRRA